jgi:ligand-binding sensor domain-containing protein/serine phosphatase RsbU (regulator of sigma subunit)
MPAFHDWGIKVKSKGLSRKRQNLWRKMTRFCLITLAAWSWADNLHAQNRQFKFDRISLEQGLSQSTVTCILQDRKGFMWFGTQDGLNKYDGYSFTIYKHDPLDPSSLSDNYVRSIYEDKTGTLWIGTFSGGLNRFDRATEQFTHFVHDPKKNNGLSNNNVQAIHEDRFGMLWIGTERGLNKLDYAAKQFAHFVNDPNNPNSLSDNDVFSIYEDRLGMLWIGTYNGGLNKFDREAEQFIRFVQDPQNPNSLSDNRVRAVHEDHTGALWIGTAGGGLNKLARSEADTANHNTQKFIHFVHDPKNPHSLSDNYVRSIYEDHTGVLWIGTIGGGLNRLDLGTGQFTRFVNDPKNPYSLSHDRILSIAEDRSGAMWIGTNGGGLNKFDRSQERFIHFANDPNNANSLNNNNVWAIYEDHVGTLWIGTDGGLNKFDRSTGGFTHFIQDRQNPHSLSDNRVWSIHEDRLGTLWIGTYGGGLNRFDRDKRQFTRYVNDPGNPHSLSNNNVWAIYEDHLGTLWIGTGGGGLNRFASRSGRGDTEQFTRFVHDPKNPHSLSDDYVRTIYEDHTGTLWIGAYSGGLNRFDRDAGQFTRFVHDPMDPHSLSHNAIRSIHESSAVKNGKATLWIGTAGGGINKLDHGTGQFTCYTEKDGLPNNVVYGIMEDDHGLLWLSTNKGLSRFNPQTKTFRNFDVADGLQSNEFNGGAYYKSRSGETFFGGINGLNVFHPDGIKDNPYVPPVVMTAFKRYKDAGAKAIAIAEKGVSERQTLELSHKDNILAFEFAALNFRHSEKNQYAYKLEGFSDQWIQLGAKHDVMFTNLDPGAYTLRVKGSNNDGVWNEEGTSLKIVITPPWWRTGWAYTLYALALIVGVFAADRFQRRRVIQKERAKAEIREAKLQAEAAELQARVLEAENARKSHELEEAQKLQLSMLPKSIPRLSHLDIAVYMKPTTEVGGDYYDFSLAPDGTLTVAIGDATGHGMKAGMMVMVAKSLFHELADHPDVPQIFANYTETIKFMQLGQLYMAMALVKIKDHRLITSSAGMPPMLIYRAATQSIEEGTSRGVPLGSFSNFAYQVEEVDLHAGDTILLMSDGLPEMFNPEGEILDYPQSKVLFEQVATASPQAIISHLVKAGQEWANGHPQEDDVTFVVLKVK